MVFPNPFTLKTTIYVHAPYASNVEAAVYDLVGRRVRALLTGFVEPGRHAITWDGRDDDGKPASSGVYVFSLKTNLQRTLVNKLLLIR